MAYLAVRSPEVHPIDCENFVPGSLRKSCGRIKVVSPCGVMHQHNSNSIALGSANEVGKDFVSGVTYDVIAFDAICLTPSTHDPSIVESDDSYDVDAFVFDCLQILDVRREMLCRTTRGKGSCTAVKNVLQRRL